MARPPGRPADEQHRRIARILHALVTHPRLGCTRTTLMTAAGLDPSNPSDVRTVRRDLKALRAAGWHIETVQRGPNDFAHRLHVIDNRIRKTFSDTQRAQLLRAAERAGLGQLYDDLDPGATSGTTGAGGPEGLGLAEHAVRHRCVLTFRYRERPRRLHPYDVFFSGDAWYLRGREEGTPQEYKTFRLSRAEDMEAEPPGSADPGRELPPPNRDPMRQRVEEPLAVVVATSEEDMPDVISHLGVNGHRTLSEAAPGAEVILEVIVTNPAAFLGRLFELDTRARLIGPESIRTRARALLLDAAGGNG